MHVVLDRFFRFILTHRKLVLLVVAVLLVISACCIPLVKVNYQFSDYLPETSESTVALHVLEDAFDNAAVPNARIMVEGFSTVQAQEFVDEIEKNPGVLSVTWLGSVVDISQPLEFYDVSVVANYKVDNSYLFQIAVDTSCAGATFSAIQEAGYAYGATDVVLAGEAVNTEFAQSSSDFEIQLILIMAVLVIIGLLLFTSHAWFEPVLFLSVIGISIVFNLGTNLIFGEISFITQMCAAILQLAVSMDYGIVMLHTYRSFLKQGLVPFNAALQSMFKASSVIASSAATTFFGFLSLCVMAFLIGMDMGLVLAKGIIFSFLSVLLIMPVLILACQKPLTRTEHRSLLPSFNKFASGCLHITIPFSIVIALIVVPVFLAQQRPNYVYGASGFVEPGTEVYEDTQRVSDTFSAAEQWVLLVPAGNWGSEVPMVHEIENLDKVTAVTSYATTISQNIPQAFVPEEALSQFISNGWSRIIISTAVEGESDESFTLVQQVRDIGTTYFGSDAHLAGSAVTSYDMSRVVSSDTLRVLGASMLAIALVLLVMFRSISIPIVLVLTIEISIWINLAIPYFLGTEIQYIGYLIISAIMLGATVDYTIILSRAYLDNRRNMPKKEAMHQALSSSAVTILTSATILTVCGILIGVISSNGVISGLGTLIGRGAFIAALNTFLLLPTLFMLLDKVIEKTTWGARFYTGD